MPQLNELGFRVRVHQQTSPNICEVDLLREGGREGEGESEQEREVRHYNTYPLLPHTYCMHIDRRQHVLKHCREEVTTLITFCQVIQCKLQQIQLTQQYKSGCGLTPTMGGVRNCAGLMTGVFRLDKTSLARLNYTTDIT